MAASTTASLADVPQAQSLNRRLLYGTLWSVLGNVLGQAVTFASAVLVARLLGRDAYGQLNIVNGAIATLGTFAGLGLGLTATKYVAEFRVTDKARAARIASALLSLGWWSGLLFGIGLWISAKWVATEVLLASSLALPLILSTPLVVLNTIGGLQASLFQGLEQFKLGAAVNIIRASIVAVVVVAACIFWGLNGVIVAMAASTAATTIWYERVLRKEFAKLGIQLKLGGIWSERYILFNFSLPALLATVLVGPANWAASTIVARLPGGFGDLGLLAAANHWRQLALLIPQVLTSVLIPLLSSERGLGNDSASQSNLVEKSQLASTLIVFPIAAAAMFASQFLIKLYGNGFASGDDLIIVTCGTAMVISIGTSFGAAIQAHGRMWLGLAINASYAGLLLAGTLMFASGYGGRALAWSTFVSYVIISVWSFWAVRSMFTRTLARRMYTALLYSISLTVLCCLTPASARIWLTPLALLASLAFVWFVLMPFGMRASAVLRLRAVLHGIAPGSVVPDTKAT